MQIKTELRYHLTSIRLATAETNKQTEYECLRRHGEIRTLCIIGENVKWYSHYGKQWLFLTNFKIGLKYNTAIPLKCIPINLRVHHLDTLIKNI